MKIKSSIAFALLGIVSGASLNAAAISYTGTTYTENFDTLISTGQTALNATVGTINATGVNGWDGTKLLGTGSTLNLIANDGSGNAGALYSYGATSSTDRALGALASGGAVAGFGASFTNDSGSSIDAITISFTAEFWRSSTTTQNILSFAYGLSTSGITSTDYLTNVSLTSEASLNVVGPLPVATNGALDGNDAANQALVSFTLTGLNWTPGSTLFIRWQDANDAGNDAGLAIDNFSLAAVPEPGTVALVGLGLGAVLYGARRKRA